jgi:hypothetical protein
MTPLYRQIVDLSVEYKSICPTGVSSVQGPVYPMEWDEVEQRGRNDGGGSAIRALSLAAQEPANHKVRSPPDLATRTTADKRRHSTIEQR